MKSNKAYYFLIPAVLLLAYFLYYPFFQAFYDSFFENSLITKGKFIGINNYLTLFSDSNFWWSFINSMIFITVTPVLMFLSLLLALMVRTKSKRNNIFRQILFIPVITPIVVVGIIWRWIFSEDIGLMNYILSQLGISGFKWLSEYPVNIIGIMIVTIWRGLGYYLMIFLAGLTIIPQELEEAATIDGASKFQIVKNIILPIIKPSIILVFVTSSTAAIKLFTEIYIMIPGAPTQNKTLVSYLFQQSFEQFNFGYGSAIGVIIFILTIGFSYINLKLMEQK